MTRLFAVLLAGIVCGSGTARADYDKTKWGMTLAQVRKLYPGGSDGQTPEAVPRKLYIVSKVIAGSPMNVRFVFDGTAKLHEVILAPVRRGSDATPTDGQLQFPSRNEGRAVVDNLEKSLTRKYGSPGRKSSTPYYSVGWSTKRDCIDLSMIESPTQDESRAMLTYTDCSSGL